jgi:predicted membrane chloride channel (bestrophin family)
MIEWFDCTGSSHLESVGYDKDSTELTVKFHNGSYIYSNVPQSVFVAFRNAPSYGKFFEKEIKGQYQFRKA